MADQSLSIFRFQKYTLGMFFPENEFSVHLENPGRTFELTLFSNTPEMFNQLVTIFPVGTSTSIARREGRIITAFDEIQLWLTSWHAAMAQGLSADEANTYAFAEVALAAEAKTLHEAVDKAFEAKAETTDDIPF